MEKRDTAATAWDPGRGDTRVRVERRVCAIPVPSAPCSGLKAGRDGGGAKASGACCSWGLRRGCLRDVLGVANGCERVVADIADSFVADGAAAATMLNTTKVQGVRRITAGLGRLGRDRGHGHGHRGLHGQQAEGGIHQQKPQTNRRTDPAPPPPNHP